MESIPPLRGAQPMVELQTLFGDVYDTILAEFIQLSQTPPDPASGEQRKQQLLAHLHGSRQRLLRLLALLNWKPWKVAAELVDHDRVLDVAAGHVRTMREVAAGLRQQAAGRIMAGGYLNAFDVNTALEVLTTGTYQELPSIILHRPPAFQPPPASLARQRARLAHVTHLIRARLVQVSLPPGLKVVRVANGTAVMRAEGLYEAKLTLVPSGPLPGVDEQPAPTGDAAGASGRAADAAAPEGAAGGGGGGWAAAAVAAAGADPAAAAAAAQRWKWRLIHFVLCIGVPFYDPRQPGQILNTCNFHMVLAADNAAYLARKRAAADAAGGGAAAAAAAAAPSESVATPSASGAPPPPGSTAAAAAATAAAAAGGGGGSLAAAVRAAEGDEAGAPLSVMHAILTDVAGRLLADELAAAARALAAPGSRWHGHIAVRPSQRLHPGVRLEYWVNAPPLLGQRALPPPGPPPGGLTEAELRAAKPGPPYLELGMGEGGCVEVVHSPSLLHKPVAVSKLRLDTWRVNVEEVLMRAANMNAQFQLLQIRAELKLKLQDAAGGRARSTRLTTLARRLWCRDGHSLAVPGTEEEGGEEAAPGAASEAGVAAAAAADGAGGGGGGAAPMDLDSRGPASPAQPQPQPHARPDGPPLPPPTAPPPEVSGLLGAAAAAAAGARDGGAGVGAGGEEGVGVALVVLNAPVLEYLVAGTTELKVGKHLFSGRLTLRPGQDERDEGSLDHAAAIAASEEAVNAAALAAYNAPSAEYPAAKALHEAVNALSRVLQRTHTSTDATHFIQAARRAALHISRLPAGMLEAFTAANPGLALEPRPRGEVATWALQSLPFPPNFPPLEPPPPDAPRGAAAAAAASAATPQCLAFFLQSRLSLTSQHVLLVVACNRQLMPLKVLSCIPVPPATYRLPEHVVAAYMAASTTGHNHNQHHPHQHQHAAAAGTASATGGGTASLASTQQPSGPSALAPLHVSGCSSPRGTTGGDAGGGVGGRSPDASPGPHDPLPPPALLPARGPSSGGVTALAGHPAAGVVGGGGGGGTMPLTSSLPSMPYASSPPHSAQQRASGGGAAGTHSPPHPAPGARERWASGRATGQQVAVMLAQQQLSSVVRWCRRRMVWEVLLVQLAAVGAAFVELASPPCQRVRVTRLAGTTLPCAIARRGGLAPGRVGPTCLELELGPDALAGHITARLFGTFFCAPACAPPACSGSAGGSGEHGGGGSGALAATAAAASRFVLDAAATAVAARASGGDGCVVCLQRQYCLERGESALTLVQEVAALIRMQTLLARLEMTAPARRVPCGGAGVAGARSEARPQRLALLLPPPTPLSRQQQLRSGQEAAAHYGRTAGGDAAAGGGARPLQQHNGQQSAQHPPQPPHIPAEVKQPWAWGEGCSAGPPPAKRVKSEPGLDAMDAAALANGGGWSRHGSYSSLAPNGWAPGAGAPDGGAGAARGGVGPGHQPQHTAQHRHQNSGCDGLVWHWPLVGTLSLEAYGCIAATLSFSPWRAEAHDHKPPPQQQQAQGADASASALPPPPLQLHVTWAPRDSSYLYGAAASGGGAAARATSPGVPAPTPGGAAAATPAPTPMGGAVASPDAAIVTTTRAVVGRGGGVSGEPYGSSYSDLVLCTASCSSGHSLPPEYLHVLEEFAEAGEEGKLLDALAVAAWPLAGFCAALRPPLLAAHGLAETDVRPAMHAPPFCHRIVCRRRATRTAGHALVLVDLMTQAVGRSYLRFSVPSAPGQGAAASLAAGVGLTDALGGGSAGAPPERQSTNGGAGGGGAGTGGAAGAGGGAADGGSGASVLAALQQQAVARLGADVHMVVGGRGAATGGPGQRAAPAPGPGTPLWLLVPNDRVLQAVELTYSLLNSG